MGKCKWIIFVRGLIVVLVLVYKVSFSQEFKLPVADPEAMALIKAISNPVSTYTGVPSTNIPLYTIKVNGFEVPIALSYQGGGIKVAEEASLIGLGWDINIGSITRVVRGIDDFGYDDAPIGGDVQIYNGYSGYLGYGSLSTSDLTICPQNEHYYTGANGLTLTNEMEPDMFYYSFCGYSGKFILNRKESKTDNIHGVIFIDQNGLDIKFIGEDHITVHDQNGIEFKFHKGTSVRTGSKSFQTRIPNENNYQPPSENYSTPYTSKWLIDEINLPSGDQIKYHYSWDLYNNLSVTNRSKRWAYSLPWDALPLSILSNLPCWVDSSTDSYYTYSVQETSRTETLDSISFNGGHLEFTYDSRVDLRPNPSQSGLRLTGIKVFNNVSTKPVTEWSLYQSYFNSSYIGRDNSYLYLRLKLDSIKQSGQPPYSFKYCETVSLPRKNSPSTDHWGYYNGVPNIDSDGRDMIVPEVSFKFKKGDEIQLVTDEDEGENESDEGAVNPLDYLPFMLFKGADRTPNHDYAKAAILESVTFPTGATRNFDYEANQYYKNALECELVTNHESLSLEPDSHGDIPTLGSLAFHLDSSEVRLTRYDGQLGYFGKQIRITTILMAQDGVTIPNDIYLRLEDKDGHGVHVMKYKGEPSDSDTIWVAPGNYNLKLMSNGDFIVRADIWYESASCTFMINAPAPGFRIKAVRDSEKTTYFDYSCSDKITKPSSGVLFNLPEYRILEYSGVCEDGNPVIPENHLLAYPVLWVSSDSQQPIAGYGGTMGYSEVREYSVINGDTSSVTYFYHNKPEKGYSYRIPNLPNIPNLSNGLLKKTEYKINSRKLKEEIFNYERDSVKSKNMISAHYDKGAANIDYYMNKSEWWKLISKEIKMFYENDSIYTLENYQYNPDNYLLSQTDTKTSDGSYMSSKTLYPEDLNLIHLTFNDITGIPVRKETIVNNQLVNGISYQYNSKGLLTNVHKLEIPSLTQNGFSPNTPYIPTNYFQRELYHYNSANKVDEYKIIGDLSTSYYWGYDDTYPVAKVENCSYLDLYGNSTLISQLDSLSLFTEISNTNWLALKKLNTNIRVALGNNKLITTYTFAPLVGMTSKTDPNGVASYFDYDSLNRLIIVRDNDYAPIKKYTYHYDGQPATDDVFTFSITFDSQGGSVVPLRRVARGMTVSEPEEPTKAGFVFGGWYTNSAFTNTWDFDTNTVTSNITLYAKWNCKVSFSSLGGSSVPSVTVNIGSTITEPTAPTLYCSTFQGWFKDSWCTSEWNFDSDVVTTNTTLYAKWTPITYTVTATKTGSGTISPSGNSTVDCQGDITYTFTPATGYHIGDVSVNGTSVGAVSSYTFSNITENKTIAVQFAVSNYLTASPTSLGFNQSRSSSTITVSSNVNWTVTSNVSWLTVSPWSGTNSSTFTVTCSRFPDLSGSRSGTITITGGGITVTIPVIQNVFEVQ